MKISYKKILIDYMCYFPLFNIIFYSVLHGGYTSFFYAFSEVLIIFLALRIYKISVRDAVLLLLMVLYIPFAYFAHDYAGEIPILINFIYFVAVSLTLNNNKFKHDLADSIISNEKQITISNIVYILIIVLSIISGSGLRVGWGTTTLQGPYGTPHTLAYELLILICLNLFLILENRKVINIIITSVFVAMLLFTAVRSALIALLVILFFFISRFGISRKILILIGASAIGAYVFLTTAILDPILEKTNLAISNGSISNGRPWIFQSSINTFFNFNGNEKWILGIGYNKLLEGNLRLINYTIQAHNDILNAFISFGVIICAIFIYSIFRLSSGSKGYFYKLVLIMLLVNLNGLVSYMSFAVPIMISMIYLESEKITEKSRLYRRKRKRISMRKKSLPISIDRDTL